MSAEALRALRESVALSERDHVAVIAAEGSGAFDALDRLVSGDLWIQTGRARHTLLLHEDGTPLADVYVSARDDDFLLLAEGAPGRELVEHLEGHRPPGAAASFRLLDDRAVLGLDGPYAWELAAAVLGPDVMALPYLTTCELDGASCLRAGKTGEYGFDLVVPRAAAAAWRERLLEAGRPFDLGRAGLEELDHCALENFFFNVRREGRSGATPLELQLQWRVSRRKAFVGSDALAARRARGIRERLSCLVGPGPISVGDALLHGGRAVGRVVNAGWSEPRGEWVASALVSRELAHSGVGGFELAGSPARAPLRTVSPPVLDNRSLYVHPQRHGYLTRGDVRWPPIA